MVFFTGLGATARGVTPPRRSVLCVRMPNNWPRSKYGMPQARICRPHAGLPKALGRWAAAFDFEA